MKLLAAILAMLSAAGWCTAATMGQAAPPTPAQSEQIAKAGTFSGTIGKGHLVKGHGFSHVDLRLEVTADNGSKETFYLRENTIAVDASGKWLAWGYVSHLEGKKVEVKYATITDATGGLGKVENGRNGALLVRFLNWSAEK